MSSMYSNLLKSVYKTPFTSRSVTIIAHIHRTISAYVIIFKTLCAMDNLKIHKNDVSIHNCFVFLFDNKLIKLI